jgi:hypothetical protein
MFMNDSFEDQGTLEVASQGIDCEAVRGAEIGSCEAPVGVPARCELLEEGLGI